MAAPIATTSSGFTDLFSVFPLKYSLTNCWIFGIRVEPPTKTISSISDLSILASLNNWSIGSTHLLNSGIHKRSKFALVNVV